MYLRRAASFFLVEVNVKKLLFRGPIMTASGYGVHARMLLRCLIESGKYDITISSTGWGSTAFIYEKTPFFEQIRAMAAKFDPSKPEDWDLSIQVTIPNEFARLAKRNIGVTAGIETDRVDASWIQKVNENIDLLIVPSEHSSQVFKQSSYQLPTGGMIKLEKPIRVVSEWVDTKYFNSEPLSETEKKETLARFPLFHSNFNFLSVGLGLDKGEGEDRKNFFLLIKWFCEQFKERSDVGLVLKLSILNNSPSDFYTVRQRIDMIKKQTGARRFPSIHLVHGRLDDHEMSLLYKHPKIKSYVTLTHGEGFGLPILEAASCGLPVLATNWSGHLDFLKIDETNKFVPIQYELKEIPDSVVWNGVMPKGSRWASPLESDSKMKMTKVIISYEKPSAWARDLALHLEKTVNLQSPLLFESIIDSVSSGISPTPRLNVRDQKKSKDLIESYRSRFKVTDKKILLFTMPVSAGDVFIATGVVASLRKKHPEHHIYFATSPRFFQILEGNPDIDSVVEIESWMTDVPTCEQVFDESYTPNLDIQLSTSNWVRRGRGRKLADEMAYRCEVEYGAPKISLKTPGSEVLGLLPAVRKYIVFHPGSGIDKWSARNYKHWAHVIAQLPALGPQVVQIGMSDDMTVPGVDVDLRGKTNDYREMAWVIANARLSVGIDSLPMHLAAGLSIPHVAIFGSTYPSSTGPANKGILNVLIETNDRHGCERACYDNRCFVDNDNPCVNEIDSENIVSAINQIVEESK